ncbi:acylneuraminate cytidylyltransferase family protein [Ruminococcaceae bacterium OttesenSCG-928-I18]|nr:acylneuraminate cytidylyltransferase family protein [Ruminococcaceae bacterium OttesenSCG-928-I18]
MGAKVILTICGRAGSKGFKNKNLKTFCGKPLVHYSLSAAELFCRLRPDLKIDIVLNTDSGLLRELVVNSYPEVTALNRPASLCGDTVPKMAVFQQSVRQMEERRGERYDFHMDLDITSPLRTAADVAACYAKMEQGQGLDVVMSAVKSRRSPYMNMAKRVEDHVEQVVPTRFTARQQVPQCYDLNASVYVFRRAFLAQNETGFLWDGKCEIVEMEDTAVLDIDSEEDFELMELIARHLYAQKPSFAEVRDNIR